MNSKLFVDKVQQIYLQDGMTLFETIQAVMDEEELDIDEVTEILKEEKTLLNDLRAECESVGLLKGVNKMVDIEELF